MRPVLPMERNPITLDDLEAMFGLFAGVDGHKRAADDVNAWMVAAGAARWTRAEVAAASLTVAATWTGYRVMPGHVTEQIVRDRTQIRQAWYCPDPPRELREDPTAEIVWRRRAHRDFSDRALFALATGQPLDGVPMLRVIEPEPVRTLPEREQKHQLRGVTRRLGEQRAIPSGQEGRAASTTNTGVPRWADLDTAERLAVRAELDARAASAMGEDTRRAVRDHRDEQVS